jgi:hypothetical protein
VGIRPGDRSGHKFLDIILSSNCLSISIVEFAVCEEAPSCCNQQERSPFNNEMNYIMISWHFSAVTVSEKKIGFTICLRDIAHQQPIFWECSGTS